MPIGSSRVLVWTGKPGSRDHSDPASRVDLRPGWRRSRSCSSPPTRGTVPLDLPREFREIDEEVRLGAFRHAVELILVPGTRPVNLLRKLNENQPQVVHFSGHGNPDEIVLESGDEANAAGRSGTADTVAR